jgi:hypothetical protein
VAATLAGLLSWAAAERLKPFFSIPEPIKDPKDRIHSGRTAAQFIAATRDASLAWGVTGGLLGLALGAVGGGATASARLLPAAVAGAVLGVILGAAPTLAVFPFYWDYKHLHNTEDQLSLSLAAHALSWAPLGLAGGLALGIGLRRPGGTLRAAVGGLSGAFLGVVAYEILGAFVLPYDAVASEAVPGAAYARLMAVLLVALGAATGATLAMSERHRAAATPGPQDHADQPCSRGMKNPSDRPSVPEESRIPAPPPAAPRPSATE